MAEKETATETKRDRVRRLLIDPLARDGMRFKAQVSPEDQRKRLDRMADDLTYMSDANLSRLRITLSTKGDGAKGDFWPRRVTVLKFANMAQHRPIEDIPGFRSWFASAAGVEAARVPGLLQAQYLFWCREFHPPVADVHARAVTMKAKELAEREGYLNRRLAEGACLSPQDAEWLRRYTAKGEMLRGWIAGKVGAAA